MEADVQPALGAGDRVSARSNGDLGLVIKVNNGSVRVLFDDGLAGEFDHTDDLVLVRRGKPFGVGDRVRSKGLGWRKCDRGLLGEVVKVDNDSVHVLFVGNSTAGEYGPAHEFFTLVHNTARRALRNAARAAAHAT